MPPRLRRYRRREWDPRNPLASVPDEAAGPVQDFIASYLETALWSESDDEGEPLDQGYKVGDIHPDTMNQMLSDAMAFVNENYADIAEVGGWFQRAGHDFWLTRNGHGAGFWDGDWPEPQASRLTESSKKFGEMTLLVGDDDKIHGL